MTKKKSITRRWFNEWSKEYENTLGSIGFHGRLLDLAVRASSVKRGSRVLDVGCGTGLLSLRFLRKAHCSIVGVDSSREMLAIFKKTIDKLRLRNNISCKFMDASSLRFPDKSFDIVASTLTLHHLEDKLKPLKKIRRLLKPGGEFILGDIDMDAGGKINDPKRLKSMLKVLNDIWISAMRDTGPGGFERMFDNGKKHIFRDGESCVSFKIWSNLCRKAGFKKITVKATPGYKNFKVLIAKKD